MAYQGDLQKAGIVDVDDRLEIGTKSRQYVELHLEVQSDATLAKGDLVYISGYDATTKRPAVSIADANVLGKVATHVMNSALTSSTDTGTAKLMGLVIGTASENLDTNSFSVGDLIYLTATGTTTNTWDTIPSGVDDVVKAVGTVIVSSSTVGQIFFYVGLNSPQSLGNVAIPDISITTAKLAANAVTSAKVEVGLLQYQDTQLNDAAILALAGTPQVVVTAPGAGLAILVHSVFMYLVVGAGAYDDVASDGNLNLIYDTGGDASAGINMEADAFIDAASSTGRFWGGSYDYVGDGPAMVTPIANKSIKLDNDGAEYTTAGNDTATNTLSIRVWYSVVPFVAFT